LELLTIEEQTAKKAEEILKLREKQAQLDKTQSGISRAGFGASALTGADLLALNNQSNLNDLVQEQVDLINKRNAINAENVTLETKITEQIGQGATFTNASVEPNKKIKDLSKEIEKSTAKRLNDLGLINKRESEFQSLISATQKIVSENEKERASKLKSETIQEGGIDFSAGYTPTIEIADIDDSLVTKNLLKFKEKIVSFNTELNGLVTNSLSNTFANIGQSLGQALAEGGNVIESVGKTILNSLGAFLGELGYMMIQYGTMAIVKAKLDASLLVPGAGFVTGPLAIAAGVALVALSSAIGAKASGGGGGSSVGSSVASQSFSGGGVGGLGGGVRDLTGELVVRGTDLVYVLGQSNNKIAKG
jgi:hypothetical protein